MIGRYLNPPENAVVFSVDEKTALQPLDRTVPVLPMSPGRAERHGFEYYRHGARSLIAARDTQRAKCRGRHCPDRRRALPCLPQGDRRESAAGPGDPRHRRQPLLSQD